MEENFDALEVIARTRGKVDIDSKPTGDSLFILWGSLTAAVYLAEFILWQAFRQEWCVWMWICIPSVGVPLTVAIIRKDHEKTHLRSLSSKLVLDYWILAACAFGVGGFLFDSFGLYETLENPLICLLRGIGSFITGETLRFKPMTAGGIIGAVIGFGAFLIQGDIWVWQTLCVVGAAISALVVPGLLFNKRAKDGI